MAVLAIRRVAERRGLCLPDARIAVVGARGSVGTLAARLLARARPRRMLLVGNPANGVAALRALAARLACDPRAIEITTDLSRLAACDVVLSAAGAARPVLDAAPICAGTIVCDVARPPDASPALRARADVSVIDGGLVALPDPTVTFGAGNIQGFPAGVALACLSETILLALAGETRDRGIGEDVPLEEVDEVLALAELHGFRLVEPPEGALDLPLRRSA
jgi:predicted amino acid dehydrogenase